MSSRRLIVSCITFACLSACTEEKAPAPVASASASEHASVGPLATLAPSASAPTASASASAPAPIASAAPAGRQDIAGASLLLVSFKGAELPRPGVTRSKAEAKKRAEEALVKIKVQNVPFEDVVKAYTDDEGTKKTAGALGNFARGAMPDAFTDAVFAMQVGEISNVVETPRGYYVIKRTR